MSKPVSSKKLMLVLTSLMLAFSVGLIFPAGGAAAQAGLARAKELYLSAAYDDALAMLDGLQEKATGTAGLEVAQYRAFCLLALQRTDEAAKVIEGMVGVDPLYRMSDSQVSPRVATFFQEVRRTVLPAIVRRIYADARAALDRKDPDATTQFERVLVLLRDPDMRDAADADFSALVTGFRDLSRAISTSSRTAPAPAGAESGRMPATPPTVPQPAPPQAPLPSPTPDDEVAVAATLRAFEQAYSRRDVAAVVALFPSVNALVLTQGFTQMKAQRIEILRPRLSLSGETATVTCQLRQRFEPRTGRSSDSTAAAIFRLRKTGGVWVIVDRR